MGSTVWTPEEKQILLRLWHDGKSAREIGLVLDKSRNAVIGQVHRMKVVRDAATIEKAKVPKEERRRRALLAAANLRARRLTEKLDAERQEQIRQIEARAKMVNHAPETASGSAVRLIETYNDQCRWPLWDDSDQTFDRPVCGASGCDMNAGRPYCHTHARIAYRRAREMTLLPSKLRRGFGYR